MTQTIDQWFYGQQGTQRGPVDFQALRAMATSGQLQPADLVWREGMTDWSPASSIEGLFAAIAPTGYAPTTYAPPGYAAPVGGPIPMSYYTPNVDQIYVGFWWRVLAYFIDYIITNVVMFIVGLFIGFAIGIAGGGSKSAEDVAGAVAGLIGIVLSWLYFALMESSAAQGTLGKLAIGVRVTDLEGQRIGFGRATGRYFSKILSALILCVGFMMVGWTERKQGLHDQIASTLVLKGRPLP
jgi:uncharacterized RDD family membrane protein YckC